MEGAHLVPWEQWLSLLRRIAYNVTVGWIRGEPMPLNFSFECGAKVILIMGTVQVQDHPLSLPDNASGDVEDVTTGAAASAHEDLALAGRAESRKAVKGAGS